MKTLKILFAILLLASFTTLPSCNQENEEPIKGAFSDGVFIVNEGPFQTGTGTITFFKADSTIVRQDIFEKTNGRPLGNIAQSMTLFNGKGYIVVNNSEKVEIVDALSFKSTGTITGLKNPGQFLGINETKGYVSTWDGNVAVIDLATNQVSKKIAAGTGPDAMIKSGGYVYVANTGGFSLDSTITVIDFATDKVVKTILVGNAPSGLAVDAYGKIWVLCKGKGFDGWAQPGDTPGKLLRIDPATLKIEYTYNFTTNSIHPDKLVINDQKTMVYFLFNNGIYKFNLTLANATPEKVVSRAFYSLGYENKTNYLYAGDAKNYTSNGIVLRLKADNGKTVDSIQAGIVPRGFAFDE